MMNHENQAKFISFSEFKLKTEMKKSNLERMKTRRTRFYWKISEVFLKFKIKDKMLKISIRDIWDTRLISSMKEKSER